MDAQRALLDQLMGKERNASFEEREKMQRHFWDDDVCKYFLVGLCPYELFKNTKSDLGEYDKLFDMRAKTEWDNLSQEDKDKYPYQWDLMDFLKRLIEDCNRRIQRNKERCEMDEKIKNEPKKLNEDEARRLGEIQTEIAKISKEAEEYGENGDVEQARVLSMRVESLKTESELIMKKPDDICTNTRTMIVCEVSGVLMSSTDSESRLKSLYAGKQYQGWKKVRDFYLELKDALTESADQAALGHMRRMRDGTQTVRGIGTEIGTDEGTGTVTVTVTADVTVATNAIVEIVTRDAGDEMIAMGKGGEIDLDLGTEIEGAEETGRAKEIGNEW
eukprot:CAMPEP_0114500446 /NCGR_PEP_ID=MMETSP0109-20121206/7966_1 /TAXON_ID=29199 /ORGANISM="Chlorarachnion reptans, Strain CCCM449" /LENGTH=331 /DNA_ID=CAMNT_0001678103 /DNA_START=71 /DNA_END=1064 /DNA_ORIENTATION=+